MASDLPLPVSELSIAGFHRVRLLFSVARAVREAGVTGYSTSDLLHITLRLASAVNYLRAAVEVGGPEQKVGREMLDQVDREIKEILEFAQSLVNRGDGGAV